MKTGLEKLDELTEKEDEFMEMIFSHLANGGSLITLADGYKIAYGHLMAWINSDKDRFNHYQRALDARAEWAREAILREIHRLSMADPRNIYNKDGTLKNPADLDDDTASIVKSFTVTELYEGVGKDRMAIGETKKIDLWSKEKALQMLAKNFGMLVEKIEHSGKLTLEDLVLASRDDKLDEQ
jgi:hypothetical protein